MLIFTGPSETAIRIVATNPAIRKKKHRTVKCLRFCNCFSFFIHFILPSCSIVCC
ncbi:hypothetical protein BACPEC_02896 [[Bacteroides] pectinophilus ATCC 43243]|uniref:Uncharacterized protein n=1 Tax=[Bacteroides] pectinophilus ATCC 43243 TaxID=483218 RepID=B7AVZ5_9FIRM|nr:hypothetical protein BACPEC_02896 [[Bacteroides] pectinophilus ATCC 43243]